MVVQAKTKEMIFKNRYKMKRIGFVSVGVLFVFLSCKKEKEAMVFVQEIKSYTDCIECQNWNWNDGLGYCTPKDSMGFFTIKVEKSGELSMDYILGYTVYNMISGHDIVYQGALSITGGVFFENHNLYTGYVPYKTSVEKGMTITFSGYRIYVKNLKIVGNTNDNSDDF